MLLEHIKESYFVKKGTNECAKGLDQDQPEQSAQTDLPESF